MKLTEKLLSSRNIFSGKIIHVLEDTIELPDGKIATREYIQHSGAAAIIAITADNQIVLEHQYRHPVKKIMLEIPAGKIDPLENPLDGAKRELHEETGYHAKNWHKLGSVLPCIGYSNEHITYYLATDLSKSAPNLDEGEFIETFTLPFDECMELVYNNELTDGKTISGLMLYHGYLQKHPLR